MLACLDLVDFWFLLNAMFPRFVKNELTCAYDRKQKLKRVGVSDYDSEVYINED